MRARLAVLAVAGLIAVLGVTAITASGAGDETEVRITAQRLADGRTEFALQQREADDGWSARLLPRARFFPATASVGRWLVSTPLTVRAPGDGDDAEGAEVRITAQRLANGRIEFALQEREADGEWGERLLPRARFFPATATVGRWLVSTPLTVSLPDLLLGTAADGGSVASDRAALVALYNATKGARWSTRTNWLSGRPLDEWRGVTTNSDGRVTELELGNNQLTGPIPAELGDLTNLEWLVLAANRLTGPIPAELGNLTNLQALALSDNQLTGPIPAELGNLTNLRELYLGFNELTGPIPAGLGNLTNLSQLDLRRNQLTGPIPAELGDLTNLEWLVLWDNQLTGPIPAELGNLTNLEILFLGGNQLTGPIPAGLGNLTNLSQLDLRRNQLTGPIPAWLGDLTNLVYLGLSGNELTGCVPVGLRDVAEENDLGELELPDCGFWGATEIRVGADVRGAVGSQDDIDYFRFRALRGQTYQIDVALGTLDDSIVSLYGGDGSFLESNDDYGDTLASRLLWEAPSSGERYVAVEGYGTGTYTLTVSLPGRLVDTAEDGGSVASDRAALVALYNATGGPGWSASTNWLSGRPLDEWLGVTTDSGGRVTALSLVDNELTGPIPAELGDLTNLRTLILWTNDELTGPIPAWLGDLTNLRQLILGGNGLTGEIPPELAGLSNLTSLDLRSNGLTGEIPSELAGLSNLQRLYLNHNRLTGEIPPELGRLSNLTELYLNDNRLTGEIPPELGRLSNLMKLGLYANQLTGEIPPELGRLSNLTSLSLRSNGLTGEIPPELGGLSNLTSLILNHNRLTGGIPPELGGLSNLDFLWLRGNQLTGCIPEGLRDIEANDLGDRNLPDCGS